MSTLCDATMGGHLCSLVAGHRGQHQEATERAVVQWGAGAEEEDPRDARIRDLEAECAEHQRGRAAVERKFIEIAASESNKALRARVVALESALAEALEEMGDALGYVPPWAREKWAYDATVERLRAVLEKRG